MDIQKTTVEEFKAGRGIAPEFTPVRLIDTPLRAVKGITIKADFLNFAPIHIGHDSSVSAVGDGTGYRLDPGEEITIGIDSLDKIWVVGLGQGQQYSWIVV